MLLSIDYGEKRIGLAVADETNCIPLPFKELSNTGIDLVIKELSQIIKDEKITKVIVGFPLNLLGKESQKTKEIQKFIDILAKKISVSVEKVDERFSSRLADVLSKGTKGSRDIGSAMIILEDFLSKKTK